MDRVELTTEKVATLSPSNCPPVSLCHPDDGDAKRASGSQDIGSVTHQGLQAEMEGEVRVDDPGPSVMTSTAATDAIISVSAIVTEVRTRAGRLLKSVNRLFLNISQKLFTTLI